MLRPSLLAALVVLVAGPALAQENSIYLRCYIDGPSYQLCVFDPERQEFVSIEAPPQTDPSRTTAFTTYAISPGGDRLARIDFDQEAFVVSDLDGSDPQSVAFSTVPQRYSLSPGADRIAYTDQAGIKVVDIETGIETALPVGGGNSIKRDFLEWSPNGERLIYVRSLSGSQELTFMVSTDGSGEEVQLTVPPEDAVNMDNNDLHADWAPDGRSVAVYRLYPTVNSPGPFPDYVGQVVVVPIIGGGETRTIDMSDVFRTGVGGASGIEFSLDGEQLAFSHTGVEPQEIRFSLSLMPVTGGPLRTVYTMLGSQRSASRPIVQTTFEWVGLGLSDDIAVNSVADRPQNPGVSRCDTGQTVTDADGDEVPECTLRAAIQTANARTGRDSISVDIAAPGVHTVALATPLPEITEPLVLDATTQSSYAGSPLLVITGAHETGFTLAVGETTLRGLAIGGFSDAGVRMSGPGGNRVEASHIGLVGDAARPNGTGIVVDGSPDHVIGGATTGAGNVISGNTEQGVLIVGAGASGVVVSGNRIGTTADGSTALGNGAEGVRVEGAPGARLGGATEAERNVISGNGFFGVRILGEGASGVTVAGNTIGTDATGTVALPNGGSTTTGVVVDGAPGAVIGGETAVEGNVILGGIHIEGPGADGARIQGNRINLSADGSAELDPEAFTGILVEYASGVTIGGPTDVPGRAPGNAIVASAPFSNGIAVLGEDDPDKGPADDLRVLGNLVGTDGSGTAAIPVGEEGILLRGLVRNAQIGQAGGGNVIVTDRDVAVAAIDLGADLGAPDGLTVAGNTIGMSLGGTAVLGDVSDGIRVGGNETNRGVEDVTIGGSGAAGNRIAAETGLFLVGGRTSQATVLNNVLGLLANGLLARDDAADGITLLLANEVTLDGNVVVGFERGIVLASNANVLTRNRIGTNEGGSVSRANDIGIVIPREATGLGDPVALGNDNVIGEAGAGNVISGNASIGLLIGPTVAFQSGPFLTGRSDRARVHLAAPDSTSLARLAASPARASGEEGHPRAGDGATNNLVEANRIGETLSGAALGNGAAGVLVQDGRGNRLLGNAVAGGLFGVFVGGTAEAEAPGETALAGNTFRATQTAGVFVSDADHTLLTALPLEPDGEPVGNTFEDNGGAGVTFRLDDATSVGNRVRGASFQRNAGPSIVLTNEGDAYPPFAPQPPAVYTAVATGQSATVRFRAGVTGEAEIFTSPDCAAGHADGEPMTRVAGSSGLSTVVVPVTIAAPILTAYVAATVTTPGDDGTTSAFSTCVRIADEESVAEAVVADGETGEVLDEVDVQVTITDNPSLARRAVSTGGTLYALRYGPRLAPQPGPFEGSATAPDGSTVTPDAVASDRYWDLRADGLSGVTYGLCLDAADVDGIQNPDRLVVLRRETTGHPWTPYATTREGSRLCATGLTGWGEIGIGALQTENPVPNEPEPEAGPEALAVVAFPNPSRGTATVRLAIPTSGVVRATVHDALGRQVAVLRDGAVPAGVTEVPLPRLAPGVYVVRLSAPTGARSAVVTVVR